MSLLDICCYLFFYYQLLFASYCFIVGHWLLVICFLLVIGCVLMLYVYDTIQ